MLAESLPNVLFFHIGYPDLLSSDILSLCYVLKERKTNLRIYYDRWNKGWFTIPTKTFRKFGISEPSLNLNNLLHLLCKEMEPILADSVNIQVNFLMLIVACKIFLINCSKCSTVYQLTCSNYYLVQTKYWF